MEKNFLPFTVSLLLNCWDKRNYYVAVSPRRNGRIKTTGAFSVFWDEGEKCNGCITPGIVFTGMNVILCGGSALIQDRTVLPFRGIRDSKKFLSIILRFPGYFNGIFYHKCLKISIHFIIKFLISISRSKYQISKQITIIHFS